MSQKKSDNTRKEGKSRSVEEIIEDIKSKSDYPDDIPSPFLLDFLSGIPEKKLKKA